MTGNEPTSRTCSLLLLLLLLLLTHYSAPLKAHRAKPTLTYQGMAKHSDCKLKCNMTHTGLQHM